MTNSGGDGGGRGAAGLLSEARLVTVIVPVSPCCQPWQWNMISPPPHLPLNQSWVSLWRGGGERDAVQGQHF